MNMNFLELVYRRKNNWWRYLLTIVLSSLLGGFVSLLFIFIGMRAYQYVTPEMLGMQAIERGQALYANMGYEKAFVSIMSVFVVLLLFFVIFYKLLHKGKIKDLLTAAPKFRYGKFFFGVGVYGAILLLLGILPCILMGGDTLEFSFNAKDFFFGLLLMLLLFPFQTLYEEIVIRGYCQQGMALLTRNKWVIIVVSSLLFGGLHFVNMPVVENGPWVVIIYVLTGLGLALCVVLDDGLEMAWGIHFINNILSVAIIDFPNSDIRMPALFTSSEPSEMEVLSLIGIVVFYVVFLFVATKVYHWDWRSLNKPVERPAVEEPAEAE